VRAVPGTLLFRTDDVFTHDEESSFFRMRSLYFNFFLKEKREEEDSLEI
jgi:hypothetical protein